MYMIKKVKGQTDLNRSGNKKDKIYDTWAHNEGGRSGKWKIVSP